MNLKMHEFKGKNSNESCMECGCLGTNTIHRIGHTFAGPRHYLLCYCGFNRFNHIHVHPYNREGCRLGVLPPPNEHICAICFWPLKDHKKKTIVKDPIHNSIRDTIWPSNQGPIAVRDMEDSHLLNAISLMRRLMQDEKDDLNVKFKDNPYIRGTWIDRTIQGLAQMIQDQTVDSYARLRIPEFGALIHERNLRGLG